MNVKSAWLDFSGWRKRFILLSLAAALVFALLLLRLWYLQVISAERYLALSEKNRIRHVAIAAPRGPIYDRNGELLVDNRPSFGISVLRQEVDDEADLLDRLAGYLQVPREDLQKRWDAGLRFPSFRPVPLAEDISRDVLELVQENSVNLPGVLIEVRPLRSYPYAESAAHLFGYLGEITEAELQSKDFEGYRPGDFVGKSGLEKSLEPKLRGIAGQRRVEVDVRGKELRLLKIQDSVPGNKVYLTIDRKLQQATEAAFGETSGSAVVMDVRTGAVLAMASLPSFNPALFARGISGEEWINLLQNPHHPQQKKTIKGQYPPASTFKIVTALAALKAGIANPATSVNCTGSFSLGNRAFRCWKRHGHGRVDLKKALKESCDIWFYQFGLELGIDRLSQMAFDLGLGESLGFPLEYEKSGLIPTRQWKKKRFGTRWYDGETVIASIGQGYVLTTPLQLATMMSTVVNGGTVLRPQVVRRVESLGGELLREVTPQVIKSTPLAPGDLKVVLKALDAVVNEPGGTAWSSRINEVQYGGKTGTAQVVRLRDDRDRKREIPYQFRDHGLFVGYAPVDDPQIVVAVVVEHGGGGGSAAAPVARKIIASYFGIEEPAVVAAPVEPTEPAAEDSAAEDGAASGEPAAALDPAAEPLSPVEE
ncbi:MAG: penicillin-binding protein 2 [Trichloromonadaceae bacterium]